MPNRLRATSQDRPFWKEVRTVRGRELARSLWGDASLAAAARQLQDDGAAWDDIFDRIAAYNTERYAKFWDDWLRRRPSESFNSQAGGIRGPRRRMYHTLIERVGFDWLWDNLDAVPEGDDPLTHLREMAGINARARHGSGEE